MKDMSPTTLKQAKRYGVDLSDLISFAEEYGYKFHKVEHRKSPYTKAIDYVLVYDPEDGAPTFDNLVAVEVMHGNCFECGEKCVAYGWAEGGAHTTTCSCECVDFS